MRELDFAVTRKSFSERTSSMKPNYFVAQLALVALAFVVVLLGRGSVKAQGGFSTTPGGTITCVKEATVAGMHCRDNSTGETYHLEIDRLPTSAIVTINGKPPRWVPIKYSLPLPKKADGTIDYMAMGQDKRYENLTAVVAHWVCDKGFDLDGFTVTWPSGVARIEPARCRAKESAKIQMPREEDGDDTEAICEVLKSLDKSATCKAKEKP